MNDYAELLNELDVDALRKKVENQDPFPFFYIDNFLNEEFANNIHDAFPSYNNALNMGKTFNAVNEEKKVQITDSKLFPEPIEKLNELLSSDEFMRLISHIFGINGLVSDPNLTGGGIHETNGGGRLDVHVDFNFNKELDLFRRVNILIYFNKNWKKEYGGVLDLWDKDVKKCYARILPVFNRMVCFATSEISFHGVTPLICPPGITRKSFASYYYNDGKDGADKITPHSTIFKARPNEYLRGYVMMPAESVKKGTKKIFNKFKNFVKTIL